jgi:hypothetical protein
MPSFREARAYFEVDLIGDLQEPDEAIFYWDDGYFDDPVFGFLDGGLHPALVSSLMVVPEETNRKRAGGVQFDVFVCNSIMLPATGAVRGGNGAEGVVDTVWQLRVGDPTNGVDTKADGWLYRDGLLSVDTIDGIVWQWQPGTYFTLMFNYASATSYVTQRFYQQEAVHLTLEKLMATPSASDGRQFDSADPILSISCLVYNPGPGTDFVASVTGTFWVTQVQF